MTLRTRKVMGLFMALVIVLSTFLGNRVSFAAGEGSITVNNTTPGKNYSAYKVFDLTLGGENNDKISYTIASEWEEFFKTGAGKEYIVDNNTGSLNAIVVDGQTKFINITEANVVDFAKKAMSVINSKTKAKTLEATANSLTFDNLDLGYYLVHPEGATEPTEANGAIVSLTSTKPTGTVNVKGNYPTVEKTADKETADYGEVINYTLNSKVPDTTGFIEYKYTLTDTLSAGLTLDTDSVVVKIDGVPVTEGVTVTPESNKLIVDINVLQYQEKVGKEIVVTYKASLNENAVIGVEGNPNKVELEYSNDPTDSTITDKTNDEEKVYTAAIKVLKHEEGDKNKPLAGAEFVLENAEGKYYKLDGANQVTWIDSIEEAKVITGATGILEFKGLKNGTYKLVETKAPEGFNKLTDPIEVVVDYKNQSNVQYQEVNVPNKSGVELPGTGGIGTTVFSIIGGAVIAISIYSLLKGKLKKEGNY